MASKKSVEFYRLRAAEMKEFADQAQDPGHRVSYLTLAEQWDRLARLAEDACTSGQPPDCAETGN